MAWAKQPSEKARDAVSNEITADIQLVHRFNLIFGSTVLVLVY